MMKLEFAPQALKSFQLIKESDSIKAEKIKAILKDALQHPEKGLGEPVALDGKLKGIWQRKISYNEYLYYFYDADSLTVASIIVDKPTENTTSDKGFKLGAFSEDDYASVMALMAANRGKDADL